MSSVPARPQPDAAGPVRVDLAHGTGIAPFTAVLWDLDGTIADSAPGIIDSIRKMLESFGLPVPPESELVTYVGPPILDSFRRNGLDDAIELEEAMARYREYYRDGGELDASPYSGVLEIIRELHAAGVPQSTATSKPESSATRILESFGIAGELDFITGATEDETRSEKAEVIAEALRRLEGAGVDCSNVLMIGDRSYDIAGAAAEGVPACYVTWGYGAAGEELGAIAVATTPDELRRVLGLAGG